MKYLFLDTSALLKRYCRETGTSWLRNLIDPANHNYAVLSEITLAEFAAAIAAKQRFGSLTTTEQQQALSLFLGHTTSEYQLLASGSAIIRSAVSLTQIYPLRGYDAVQLASAIAAKSLFAVHNITDFVFVTADNNLLTTAIAEGLNVENPNNYP